MTFELTLVGERPEDAEFLTTLLERVGDGSLVGFSDHPRVGDFGVCEFFFEFTDSGSRDDFVRVTSVLGFN